MTEKKTQKKLMVDRLEDVDLSRLVLPQFIGYFNKAEVMPFSHSPQITSNTVKTSIYDCLLAGQMLALSFGFIINNAVLADFNVAVLHK